jgi:hypothetical protein
MQHTQDVAGVSRRSALRAIRGGAAVGAGLALAPFQAFAFDEAGHFSNVSQVRVQSVLDDGLDSYAGRFESYTLDADGNAIRLDSSGLVAATRIQLARLESLDLQATG